MARTKINRPSADDDAVDSETHRHERGDCDETMPMRPANSRSPTIVCCACRPKCKTCAIARRAKLPTSASTRPCRSCRTCCRSSTTSTARSKPPKKPAKPKTCWPASGWSSSSFTRSRQHHCEPIVAEGQLFDPNFHQAILQQPSADVPAGNVMMVTQPGYKMHDRVVRPAQVIVSSGPPKVRRKM